MAVALGKRKRHLGDGVRTTAIHRPRQTSSLRVREPPANHENAEDDDDRTRELFQRAFETKFRPLEERTSHPTRHLETLSENDTESETIERDDDESVDWNGLSDEAEDEDRVEVVEVAHALARPNIEEARRGRKGFMSSKPPSSDGMSLKPALKSSDFTDPEGSEATNLKHDLALQRLLKESHLLDPAAFSTQQTSSSTATAASLEPQGKARLRALDLRIRDLGAKASVLGQRDMPMAHRKGIMARAADRESTRRREAAENGIVLERRARKQGGAGTTAAAPKRVRGIGGPTVGKFRGGTLRLSSRDIRSIEGQRMGSSGRRKGKR